MPLCGHPIISGMTSDGKELVEEIVHLCYYIFIKTTMGQDNKYPEKRDIRAIVILLATQGMIHLGEIADPLGGRKTVNINGARFFVDLLAELQRKTQGNLLAEEAVFVGETLENLQKIIAKKSNSSHE